MRHASAPGQSATIVFFGSFTKKKKDGDEPSKKKDGGWTLPGSQSTHTHFHTQVAKRKLREEIKETLNERKTNHIARTFTNNDTNHVNNKKKNNNKQEEEHQQEQQKRKAAPPLDVTDKAAPPLDVTD